MYIVKIADDAIVQLLTLGNQTKAHKCIKGLPVGATLVGATLQPSQHGADYRIVELSFTAQGHDGVEVLDVVFESCGITFENNDADDDLA